MIIKFKKIMVTILCMTLLFNSLSVFAGNEEENSTTAEAQQQINDSTDSLELLETPLVENINNNIEDHSEATTDADITDAANSDSGDDIADTEVDSGLNLDNSTPESLASQHDESDLSSSQESVAGIEPLSIISGYLVYNSTDLNTPLYQEDTLGNAFNQINNDVSGITDFTVVVTADDTDVGNTAALITAKNVTVTSSTGHNFTLSKTSNGRHLSLTSGSVTLTNITLDGNGYSGGVSVTTATITVADGAVITKNTAPASSLSGVGVSVRNGCFIMTGGEISYNIDTSSYGSSGGGVYIGETDRFDATTGSTAYIYGGSIHHNANTWGGGVELGSFSTLEMTGGEIYENTTTSGGGGIHVYVLSTFTMKGGRIYNNHAAGTSGGGVFVGQGSHVDGEPTDWAKFYFYDGTIEGNDAYTGGGITASYNGQVYMYDGCVKNNTAEAAGGGIFANLSTVDNKIVLDIYGGEITGNSTETMYGGGICVISQSGYMTYINPVTIGDPQTGDGPLITNNSAKTYGGGILLYRTEMTMYGGSISNNSAANRGGGLYIFNTTDAIFTMKGGSINNNTAAIAGGGVYMTGGEFTMEGSSAAKDSNPSLYGNLADETLSNTGSSSDDLFASGGNTKVTLLAAEDMPIPTSYYVDGWYYDYQDANSSHLRYRAGERDAYTVASGYASTSYLRLTLGITLYANNDSPTIVKQLSGDTPGSAATFNFKLIPEADYSASISGLRTTASITGAGTLVSAFGNAIFSAPGTYTFTITEQNDAVAGYTYDTAVYTWVVDVVSTSSGLSLSETLYDASAATVPHAVFNNQYTPPTVSTASPTVAKMISGDTPGSASTFTFNLTPAADYTNSVSGLNNTASITGAGTLSNAFGNAIFSAPGTYTYTISEIDEDVDGYTYDTSVYIWTVVVVENSGLLEIDLAKTKLILTENDSVLLTEAVFSNLYTKEEESTTEEEGSSEEKTTSEDDSVLETSVPSESSSTSKKTTASSQTTAASNNAVTSNAKTGDNNQMALWISLFIVALLIIGGLVIWQITSCRKGNK